MALKGKQKQYLRSLAVELTPVLQVGKSGVTATIIKQAAEVLLARELVKGRVLQASPVDVADVAAELAAATEAELVQVIGRNFLLYKAHPDEPKIQLPS